MRHPAQQNHARAMRPLRASGPRAAGVAGAVAGGIWLLIAGLAVAPLAAQTSPKPQARAADALSPQQEEALHAGMLEVRQLERSGDRAGAIQHAEALLQKFPENQRVEDVLIQLYRVDHRDDALVKLLKVRLEREPDDVEAARDLSSLLLARNAPGEAQAVLKRFIAANPRDENRYRMAGALLASRDLTEAAIQFYRQGRQAIGSETIFAPELAQLEVGRGDYAAAIAEYLLLANDPEKLPRVWREISNLIDRAEDPDLVLKRIEEMRKSHPNSAAIQDIAAMASMQLDRYPAALAAIREADRNAGDQGEHLLEFARAALQSATPVDSLPPERLRAGVEALQLLSQRHPNSNLLPEATQLGAEGLVAVARGLPDGPERAAILRQAVQLIDANESKLAAPQLATQTLALKGMILLEDLGQPEAALGVFTKVAAAQRANGEPDQMMQVQIALCHAALGHLDQARTALEQLVKADSATARPPHGQRRPNEPQHIGWSRARYYLAELDLIGGDYEKARSGFAALAEEAPEDRLANDCLDLALTLNESTGDDPKALQHFGAYRRALLLRDRKAERGELEALVQESPQAGLTPVALFDLAGVLADDHELVPAQARYQELLTQHPQHRLAARALEAIGDLQMQDLHRPDLAVTAYEKLLTDYPDDLFLDGVRKKLLAARDAAKGGTHATP